MFKYFGASHPTEKFSRYFSNPHESEYQFRFVFVTASTMPVQQTGNLVLKNRYSVR